jgi:hypothetical protein
MNELKRRPSLYAETAKSSLKSIKNFFTYSTVRTASIESKTVGITYRLSQLMILAYVIGLELIYTKGYQAFDSVSSVISTKVKGQGFLPINQSLDFKYNRDSYKNILTLKPNVSYKVIDSADYIIPANELSCKYIL